jgi:hypothetical protein
MIKKHKPNPRPSKPKSILVKYIENDILLKPHLIKRDGSLYSNPVEQIHAKKSGSPLKKRIFLKTVNFMLPHTKIRIEGVPDDNKNAYIKLPKKIQFHNKMIPANDDLRTAFTNRTRKEDVGNLSFLKKTYGKRLSTDMESSESSKRFKKETELVNPRPQRPMQFASLFRKSSPKRFNWNASLNRQIKQELPAEAPKNRNISNPSPLPKTVQVTGLFTDAISTPVKQPVIESGSRYNTPDSILKTFDDKPLIATPFLTDSDESPEINGSEILDYYDLSENCETLTVEKSDIDNDLQNRRVSVYSEQNFFQDDQSFISKSEHRHAKTDALQDLSPVKKSSPAKSIESSNAQNSPLGKRQSPLSPPSTPRTNAKTVIDVSGM